MLDQTTIDFITSLVTRKMATNMPFTSLDIANPAKEAGYFARNREVAAWLRSNVIKIAYEHGLLYNQTLITVDSKEVGATLAYLYHHMNTDPDSYFDRDQNPKPYHRTASKTMDGIRSSDEDEDDDTTTVQVTVVSSGSASDFWKSQPRDDKGRWVSK